MKLLLATAPRPLRVPLRRRIVPSVRRQRLATADFDGRAAQIMTLWGASILLIDNQLPLVTTLQTVARGLFYLLRDRPSVAALAIDGRYWNADTDADVLAARAARRGGVRS